MKKTLVAWVSSAVAVAALLGCGGSSPAPVVATVHPDLDGIVFSSGLFADDGTEMSAGDNGANLAIQSLVSFPLSLPEGATIETAVLRLYGTPVLPGPPPNAHLTGGVLVQHLQGDFGALDATDFAADPGALTSCGEFSSPAPGWNELDVTTSVQDDLSAPRTKSQFRLYNAALTDGDNEFDTDSFYASEIPVAAYQPELVITYTP